MVKELFFSPAHPEDVVPERGDKVDGPVVVEGAPAQQVAQRVAARLANPPLVTRLKESMNLVEYFGFKVAPP